MNRYDMQYFYMNRYDMQWIGPSPLKS